MRIVWMPGMRLVVWRRAPFEMKLVLFRSVVVGLHVFSHLFLIA